MTPVEYVVTVSCACIVAVIAAVIFLRAWVQYLDGRAARFADADEWRDTFLPAALDLIASEEATNDALVNLRKGHAA